MAKRIREELRVQRWTDRITAANKVYDTWDKEFECDRLSAYYRGKQWKGLPETEAQKRYVINLIFPTIETAIPALMFYHPQVKVEPRGAHADDNNSDAAARAELLEDTLQTFIDDPKIYFKAQTLLALRNVFFRFGVVEVGYSADWIDNPNAGKPVLKENNDPLTDDQDQPIAQPAKVPTREELYVRRIPPQHFRVSLSNRNILTENDWVGYCEWHYVEDIKQNPKYKTTSDLQAGGSVKELGDTSADPDHAQHVGMVKIWKVWDIRRGVKHVLADGHKTFLLEDEPAPFVPLAALKFYELDDAFYPLPPVYNWLSPQDEMNETREMQKTHRRRFTRRYTYKAGNISESELEKLETGGDGAYAQSNVDNPIVAVPDAPLSPENTVNEIEQTREDFATISGVSGESNATPQADTATQANIMNVKQQIRESQARVLVADWLSQISRLMLLTIRDKMQLPFWIKRDNDPFAHDPVARQRTVAEWKEIHATQLPDIDMDVKVDIASLSPVSEDAQRAAWMQVLSLLMNPAALSLLMTPNPDAPNEPSPLLRKTLALLGIKSDQEVKEIARVGAAALQTIVMQQMAAVAAKSGMPMPGGGSPVGPPAQAPGGVPAPGPTVQ